MKKLLIYVSVLFLSLIYLNELWADEAKISSRALFYSGEGTTFSHTEVKKTTTTVKSTSNSEPSSSQKYMGIAYWIDKVGQDGQIYRVNASKSFKGGDRIKLYVQTNRDGYLYIYNIGTSGMTNLLFPTQNTPDNFVRAYQPISVPGSGFIRFDYNPGTEKVLIMLSPNQMNIGTPSPNPPTHVYSPSTPSNQPSSPGYADSLSSPYGSSQYASNNIPDAGYIASERELNSVVSKITVASRDLFVEEVVTSERTVTTTNYNNSRTNSRDLVVEEGAQLTYDMPATYVMSPVNSFDGGKLISHEVKLKHK